VVGTVEDVSLRITTVRSANGEVVITPNGQTVQVTNLSRGWARAVIDVPVPVTVDVNQVSEILREVGEDAFKDEELHQLLLDPPSVMGVESIEVDQFKIRVVARTLPGKQFEVGRALRVRIAQAFLREGITVQPALDTAQPTGTV
jgi:small-conductance mechanosensitive channel